MNTWLRFVSFQVHDIIVCTGWARWSCGHAAAAARRLAGVTFTLQVGEESLQALGGAPQLFQHLALLLIHLLQHALQDAAHHRLRLLQDLSTRIDKQIDGIMDGWTDRYYCLFHQE